MSAEDPFRFDDAAYVLGALDPSERQAFEEHLAGCADCRARVAEARGPAALLSGLSASDIENDLTHDAPPDTLLPGLLRRAARERRRRRLLTTGLGVAAAAAVVALVVAVWPTRSDVAEPAARPVAQQFTAIRPAPVTASGVLVAKGWGTQINVQCRYTSQLSNWTAYRLVVIDSDQHRHDAGGWTLSDHPIEFTGGTEVPKDRIAAVQITRSDGRPVLQLMP